MSKKRQTYAYIQEESLTPFARKISKPNTHIMWAEYNQNRLRFTSLTHKHTIIYRNRILIQSHTHNFEWRKKKKSRNSEINEATAPFCNSLLLYDSYAEWERVDRFIILFFNALVCHLYLLRFEKQPSESVIRQRSSRKVRQYIFFYIVVRRLSCELVIFASVVWFARARSRLLCVMWCVCSILC